MRLLLRIATCVTLLLAAVSGQSRTDVILGTSDKTTGDMPTYIGEQVEQFIGDQLRQARPCVQQTSRDAATATVGTVDVQPLGDQFVVTYSSVDVGTNRATSRLQATVSASDLDALWDKLQDFAKECAKQMASSIPLCPAPDDSEKRRQKQEEEERIRLGHSVGRSDEYAGTIK